MPVETLFEEAVRKSRTLPPQPNQTLLRLYGLYKQATLGDASGARPAGFDLRNQAKFDAWSGFKGLDREAAMRRYIDLVDSLTGE